MDDLIVSINGPDFLWFYFALACVGIIVGYLVKRMDGTQSMVLPPKETLEPVDVAFLRGGRQAVVQTVLFSLIERNIVEMQQQNGKMVIAKIDETYQPTDHLEKYILDEAAVAVEPNRWLYGDSLKKKLEPLLSSVAMKLEKYQLLKTHDQHQRAKHVALFILMIFSAIGLTKLYYGLLYNKPIILLVLLFIGSVIAWHKIVYPHTMITALGKRFLAGLEREYQAKMNMQKEQMAAPFADPLWCLAVLGIGALTVLPMYSWYNQAFANPTDYNDFSRGDHNYDDGDDGGGFGGGSSDGGGGGCSGGCGGGCGGCGG